MFPLIAVAGRTTTDWVPDATRLPAATSVDPLKNCTPPEGLPAPGETAETAAVTVLPWAVSVVMVSALATTIVAPPEAGPVPLTVIECVPALRAEIPFEGTVIDAAPAVSGTVASCPITDPVASLNVTEPVGGGLPGTGTLVADIVTGWP